MIKRISELPADINDTRLTYWLTKGTGFYPSQVVFKYINSKGRTIIPKKRPKSLKKVSYVEWMYKEKHRINTCGFAEKVDIVELIGSNGIPQVAIFPMKQAKIIRGIRNEKNNNC